MHVISVNIRSFEFDFSQFEICFFESEIRWNPTILLHVTQRTVAEIACPSAAGQLAAFQGVACYFGQDTRSAAIYPPLKTAFNQAKIRCDRRPGAFGSQQRSAPSEAENLMSAF